MPEQKPELLFLNQEYLPLSHFMYKDKEYYTYNLKDNDRSMEFISSMYKGGSLNTWVKIP